MNSLQCLLVVSLIILLEARGISLKSPLWPPGTLRLGKRFPTNNLFANAQWHLANDIDDYQTLYPVPRQFGSLGQTPSMLTEGPLGTFRFG